MGQEPRIKDFARKKGRQYPSVPDRPRPPGKGPDQETCVIRPGTPFERRTTCIEAPPGPMCHFGNAHSWPVDEIVVTRLIELATPKTRVIISPTPTPSAFAPRAYGPGIDRWPPYIQNP